MSPRYVLVRQPDPEESFPAALSSVAAHYGRRVSLAKTRELAGTDSHGTTPHGIESATRALGFRASWVEADWEYLEKRVTFPAITSVTPPGGDARFVVIYRVKRGKVTVGDPTEGVGVWPRAGFLDSWGAGEPGKPPASRQRVLLLYPTSLVQAQAECPPPWRRLWSVSRSRMRILAEAVLASVVTTLLALASSYFLQILIDRVLYFRNITLLHTLALGMVVIIVFRELFSIGRYYLLKHVSQKVDTEVVLTYFGHILALPFRFFQTRSVGDIYWRFFDGRSVGSLTGDKTVGFFLDLLMLFFCGIVMLLYSWTLSLLVFAFLPLFFPLLIVIARRVRKLHRQCAEEGAVVSGHVIESILGIAVLKYHNAESRARDQVDETFLQNLRTEFKRDLLSSCAHSLSAAVAAVGWLVVLWYGALQVMSGSMTLGQLMFFSSLVGYIFTPVQGLAGLLGELQGVLVAIDRVGEVLDLPGETGARRGHSPADVQGEYCLKEVSFSYRDGEPVLKRLSLRIKPGATLGVVGPSGSGKSTLAGLLSGIYEPSGGQILLDGTDLRDWDLRTLRSRMGVVPQENFLFKGTVRENISLGLRDAGLPEVIRAAEAAGAAEFIQRLPERYDTVIGERGVNLSAGEKQRICIARALIRLPQILILDEATANLDAETEGTIQRTLSDLGRDRTIVIIAHRLATLRHVADIAVLDHGEIVEEGTHSELLARRGRYHSLWSQQSIKDGEDGREDGG